MTKAKATLSLDPHTYEKAKRTYDSVSQRVEDLIKSDMDATEIDDTELLKEELSSVGEKIDEKENDLEELRSELDQLESEKAAIETKIENKEAKKEETKDVLEKFKRVFRRKYEEREWTEPRDILHYYPDELDKSREELWKIGQEALE